MSQSEKSGNNVRKIRLALLMSKAELARKAGVSPLTIDRIEEGMECRMETKRKIILALGYKLTEKNKIFCEGEEEAQEEANVEVKEGEVSKGVGQSGEESGKNR